MKYTVLIEKGKNSYGAIVPDLPGCIAVADTQEKVIALIKEAIEFHIEGMKLESTHIPKPKIKAIELETSV